MLGEILPAVIAGFPWPKSMRWASDRVTWVRPLRDIVAVFDGELVPFEIDLGSPIDISFPLNLNGPQPNAFGEQDLQFAEIFSREIASALHTLELLSAEKRTTATQSIEAIGREVALPVDEILAAATTVLDRWIGHEPEMADKLRQILASARSVKQCIQKVGEEMTPAAALPKA